ncbi:MAG TPA: hypothetical protein VGL86_11870 [Polyangia bacterium]|jgi:hypothetical protein
MKKSSVLALALVATPAFANKDRIVPLPPSAAAAIENVRAAIDAHDFAALEKLVAPRFRDGTHAVAAAQAIADWKTRSADLDGLAGVLGDCRGRTTELVVCGGEPGLLEPDSGAGHRAHLEFERRGKRWWWTNWTP